MFGDGKANHIHCRADLFQQAHHLVQLHTALLYSIEGPLDRYIPVDVNVPGCPPRPQAILEAVVLARSIWMKKLGLEE